MGEVVKGSEARERGLENEVKVIDLKPEKVTSLRNELIHMGAKKVFDGVVENIRIDTEDRVLTKAGINARVRKYTEKLPDGTIRVQYEWTVKKKVKGNKFKSREETKGSFESSYETALTSLHTYIEELMHVPIGNLGELWRVLKHREMYVFANDHKLAKTEVVIDKMLEVSVGGNVVEGAMPTKDIPHYMEIESSTGDDGTDTFNITECGRLLDVPINGLMHDASEKDLLEHYGFIPKKEKAH